MKNFKNLFNAIVLAVVMAAVVPQVDAQILLSTGTLGANQLTTTTAGNIPPTRLVVSSTTGMSSRGTQNQYNTMIWVDKELECVVTVVSATQLDVQRGCGVGAAGIITSHASGALFYVANTVNNGTGTPGGPTTAASQISNSQETAQLFGYCSRSSITALPVIYSFSGEAFDCKRTGAAGTAGQWIKVSEGSQNVVGLAINAFCTGTVGSNEVAFLNNTTCSGATSATFRYLVNRYGTVANLRVYSSAVVVAMGSDPVILLKNGSNTAVTCTMAAGAVSCTDILHSVQVAPGDVLTFTFDSTASDSAANISATVNLY